MRVVLYYLLLASVLVLAWWRGRHDERVAAAICAGGTVLTVLASPPPAVRFDDFSPVEFAIDLAVLLAFVALALRSERFWPMWVAGLQLTSTSVHLFKLLAPDLLEVVVGAAIAVWSYPILFAIAIGALRTPIVERWRCDAELRLAD